MLKEMSLFTNIIQGEKISHFYKYDDLEWGNQYQYIQETVKEIRKKLSIDHFLKEQRKVFLITEILRKKNGCDSLRFYDTFYQELTTGFYKITDFEERNIIYQFTQSINYTELFYNLGQLSGNLGNTDMAIYYISLADKEYSIKNCLVEGSFVKLLLSSNNHFLWNIASTLICDYQNYENINGHNSKFNSMLSSFNIEINRSTFDEFFKEIDVQTLFQLVDSFSHLNKFNIGSNMKEIGTRYKSIYLYKVLGDLTWSFESYLKSNINLYFQKDMSHATLSDVLSYSLKKVDKKCSSYFSIKLAELKRNHSTEFDLNTRGLHELITGLDSADLNDSFELFSHYALIMYLYRNYSSHYMDNTLNLGTSYKLKLTLYLSIVTVFLITNDMFTKQKKNPEKS